MIQTTLCAADFICCASLLAPWPGGPAPTAPEMEEKARWVAAAFEGAAYTPEPPVGIEVLANYGPILPNLRAWKPLRVGRTALSSGVCCHAPSRIVVRLPDRGARFQALAGVDSNEQTSGGRGSVIYAVEVGGTEVWRSGVQTEATPPAQVDLTLNGATEVTLVVEDAGDGISCDQADWGEARATLEGGAELRLGDMAVFDRTRAPYPLQAPFSFTYGGRSSRELLPTWRVERTTREITDARHGARTERTLAYTDPETGLVATCVAIEYRDFPTVEWILRLRNDGTADTPILSDIRAMDVHFDRGVAGDFTLHQIRGDNCTADSYEPLATALGAGQAVHLANSGGRPTQDAFPYLNIQWAVSGALCVLGWPGQWNIDLARDTGGGLDVRGGQEATHFTLHPAEEVRSPLALLQFYDGDWLRAQNVWRRWMVAHGLPQPGGKPIPTRRAICNGGYFPGLMTVGAKELEFMRKQVDERVDFTWWTHDAGWYPCDGVGWPKVGTWEADPVRFPRGLREISDYVHAQGKRTMLWFEPERVYPGTWLAENHPEWIHGGRDGGLIDLGNPECRQWITDRVAKVLDEQGIDDYRQDFNIDPLGYWRAADTPDRQGITEIRHVEGYLAFWDELARRRPDTLFDSCASGGRRNDLETMRRSVPLLRSDWANAPEGQQCQTWGLSLWLPYQGTGFAYGPDAYWARSSMVTSLGFGIGPDGMDSARRFTEEHRRISPYFLGDFYPLTPYSKASDIWIVFQFDRPELGGGVIEAFRRPDSIYETARPKLKGLDPDAEYTLTDQQTGTVTRQSGQSLMTEGLLVATPTAPYAVAIEYRR
jgi:alpha-galactosidase